PQPPAAAARRTPADGSARARPHSGQGEPLMSLPTLPSQTAGARPVEERLRIHTEVARKMLAGFIADEIAKVGLKRAVIGLSGGIDSALSAYLSAEALGPENVLAVRMPYKSSSAD